MAVARRLLLISMLLVAACSPRGEMTLFPPDGDPDLVIPVFVGSTRTRDEKGRFIGRQLSGLSYYRFGISVPPGHQLGQIEWPRGMSDPEMDFLTTDVAVFNSSHDFSAALRRQLDKQAKGRREVVVYVHGFNNTFAEGVYRLAQLNHDFNITAAAVHYSWPSAGNPLGYAYDRDSLLAARDGLEALLRAVNNAGAEPVVLVGHSLGSLLIMEAMRQIAIADDAALDTLVGSVILISPDIDVDTFHTQAARIGRLPQPFAVFTSQKDRVLKLAARLTGQRNRLGNVDEIEELADLKITLIDVTEFSEGGSGHFTTGNSPALIALFDRLSIVDSAFSRSESSQVGLFPGLILTVQNATEIVLTPAVALTQSTSSGG